MRCTHAVKLKVWESSLYCPLFTRGLRKTYLRWPSCSILCRVCNGHVISGKLQASTVWNCVNHLPCNSSATSVRVHFHDWGRQHQQLQVCCHKSVQLPKARAHTCRNVLNMSTVLLRAWRDFKGVGNLLLRLADLYLRTYQCSVQA